MTSDEVIDYFERRVEPLRRLMRYYGCERPMADAQCRWGLPPEAVDPCQRGVMVDQQAMSLMRSPSILRISSISPGGIRLTVTLG